MRGGIVIVPTVSQQFFQLDVVLQEQAPHISPMADNLDPAGDGLITRPVVASLCGLDCDTVSMLASKDPHFPKPATTAGWHRWRRSDVLRFLRAQEGDASDGAA